MSGTSQAYLYSTVRTPFGRFGGALAKTRPDDLAAGVLRAVLERTDLDPGEVDEVVLGNANGAGEDNRNVAPIASLLAGLPVSVPGTSVNRLCGSSLDAAMIGSTTIETGGIALGHPLGASGGRILGAAAIRADGHRWGVGTICIGVGQGLAVVLENEDAS